MSYRYNRDKQIDMTSWPSFVNDRDIEMHVIPDKTDQVSHVRKEAMMILYSDVEEVKTIEDIIKNGCKIIVLMRGLPGSGKTTLAHYLMEKSVDTITTKEKHVFSADDYFRDPKSNAYIFNRKFLREAHSWNVDGVLAAAQTNVTPIIVDNTNLSVCEMWPYACIAAKYDYIIRYLEPSTHWRYNIHECAKRNLHGVSEKHIATMMGRFDRSVSESELLSLVSSQINFQNYSDTHSNCWMAITRYRQQKHYAKNCTLGSICIYNDKICKRSSINIESYSPNLPKVLLDPTNILGAQRISELRITQQFVVTSVPSTSGFPKFHPTRGIPKQHQTCKSVSLRNNVLGFYDQILKLMYFLHLFVSVRNLAVCAAQFMSLRDMYDRRQTVEKCNTLAKLDNLGQYGSISGGNKLKMMMTEDHGLQLSVNINDVKIVVFPTSIRSSLLPDSRSICRYKESSEADNRSKKGKGSRIFYREVVARFPSSVKICNVEGLATCHTNSGDLEDAKNTRCLRGECDRSKVDPWNASNNCNYDPWGVSDSGVCNSWDLCGNVSWETETISTQHITQNELDCVLPKPPRTGRKESILRHSREHNTGKIERESSLTVSTTEVETNSSLPKPQRSTRRPRIMQYPREEYASKLEPKMILPPELEAWNAVEDPLSSWERKQNTEKRTETTTRESLKSKNTYPVSGNISVKNQTFPATAKCEEEEQLISKPRREKRSRNRQ